MRVADFDFTLPQDAIADRPAVPRDGARLLVFDRQRDEVRHGVFRELGRFLSAGDLLVLNDTRVLPYRLFGKLPTGGAVECLILERHGDVARGYVRPARKIRPGREIPLEDGRLRLVPMMSLGGGQWRFRLATDGEDPGRVIEEVGRAPLPPYIPRSGCEDPGPDRASYQTVFARVPGAVAAPTAGLHFTEPLLVELQEQRIEVARVTLHVGEGTFAPVRVEEVADHAMHGEVYNLPAATAEAVARVRARGGRVVAVGTTSARTLETCASADGLVVPREGTSEIFIHPGVAVRVVDALITNFHLPRSTLLMLVAALVGRERILEIYRDALARGYRFYSFGDAMLIL